MNKLSFVLILLCFSLIGCNDKLDPRFALQDATDSCNERYRKNKPKPKFVGIRFVEAPEYFMEDIQVLNRSCRFGVQFAHRRFPLLQTLSPAEVLGKAYEDCRYRFLGNNSMKGREKREACMKGVDYFADSLSPSKYKIEKLFGEVETDTEDISNIARNDSYKHLLDIESNNESMSSNVTGV